MYEFDRKTNFLNCWGFNKLSCQNFRGLGRKTILSMCAWYRDTKWSSRISTGKTVKTRILESLYLRCTTLIFATFVWTSPFYSCNHSFDYALCVSNIPSFTTKFWEIICSFLWFDLFENKRMEILRNAFKDQIWPYPFLLQLKIMAGKTNIKYGCATFT